MLLAVKFSEFIVKVNVILGIVLACIGIACIMLSRRVTMVVDKTDAVERTSKVYVGVRVAGVILILVGMIFIALP